MRDRNLVHEAAAFLTESVATRFIRDCIQLTVTPTDGEALKAALHTRGINVRYLGFIAQIAAKREDLRHLMVREERERERGRERERERGGERKRERERERDRDREK